MSRPPGGGRAWGSGCARADFRVGSGCLPDVAGRVDEAGSGNHRPLDLLRQGKRADMTTTDIPGQLRSQGLVRPREGRVIAGVCAGLGRRFGLDPWPARLLFVLILMIIPGSQLIVYPILWILMPNEDVQPRWVPATGSWDAPPADTTSATVTSPAPPAAPAAPAQD